MPSLFGITWSPAISTMNMLKLGAVKAPYLRATLLKGIKEELDKDIKKRQKQGKEINFEVFHKQIFKDKHYVALYKELGITEQINTMIKNALTK